MVLLLILVAAFAMRVYGLDWDRGTFLHPDELHVINTVTTKITFDWPPDLDNLLDPAGSRLNPRSDDPVSGKPSNFAYGALPLLVTDLAASAATKLTGHDYNAFFGGVYRVGRLLSALLDTLTVVAVYLLGRRLHSPEAGLAGAALYATMPMMAQLSHFFTTDVWMTCFAAFSLCAAIQAADTGAFRWFAAAGALFGLAMASKASVAPLAVVIATAAMIDAGRRFTGGEPRTHALAAIPERLAVGGLAALLGFALFEPYALARPLVYLDQLREQSDIVRGTFDVPFTRQYVGTTPVLYQLEQLLRWGAGPVAGLLLLAGVASVAVKASRRETAATLVAVWLTIQGAVILFPETKFLRYLAPLLPALAAGAGLAVVLALGWLVRRVGRPGTAAVATAVALGVTLWAASFLTVYANENPRLAASRWIYQNVPSGSTLTSETWDLALPVAFTTGLTPSDRQYQILGMELYRDRAPSVVAGDIYDALTQADYVVLASNRVSAAVKQSPWRYPVQIRYYQLLADGSLGFQLAGDFHTFPGIASLHIDDSDADESWINYDHPRVLIYQKQSLIDRATYDQLMAPAVAQPWTPARHAEPEKLMLDEPVGSLPVVSDARWSERVTGHTLPALLAWVLLLAVLGATGAPLAARLFPRFPDLGWGFARLLTMLVAGYAVWILSSLEVIAFRAIWCWVAVGAIAAVATALARRGGTLARLRRRREAILGAELVFWAVFALFLAYRFINPESWHPIWGGEKPMEFAHLNAILRSAHFPPYDPWYAGGYINYYYYGIYLVAFLIKLTGIPSEIAFNLAQPTVIALLASGAYSLVAALARGLGVRRSPAIAGALGAGMLVLIGNLDAAVRAVRAFPDIQPSFYEWTWAGSRAVSGGITEFPYFTGLYADLHAHVVAWPITVMIAALCWSLIQQTRVVTVAISASPRRRPAILALLPVFAMIALACGSLFATNAWDVPAFAALAALSIFGATHGLRWLSLRFAVTLAAVLATAILAFALFQPFLSHYVTLFGSLDGTRSQTDVTQLATHFGGFLAIIALGIGAQHLRRGLALRWLAWLDPIALVVLGVAAVAAGVLFDLGAWLPLVAVLVTLLLLGLTGANAVLPAMVEHGHGRLAAVVLAAGTLAGAVLAGADRLTLAVGVGFAIAGAVLWLVGSTPAARFVGALVAAGGGIVAGVEVVYLVDDLQSLDDYYRMNTIFKFYNQAWTLFGIGAASLLAWMLLAPRPAAQIEEVTEDERAERHSRIAWSRAGSIVGALVIAAGLLTPLLTTRPRLELRFPGHPGIGTLNALDWMRYGTLPRADRSGVIAFADDLAAIRWFQENVDGSPVILEASIGPYRGNGSRIAIATGLPDVLGWDRHERQQRYPTGIDQRMVDVATLYRSDDLALKMQLLRKYDVAYVVVGDVERYSQYGGQPYSTPAGIAAFDRMVGNGLEVAFQSGTTTVYRVVPGAGASG